MKKILILTTLIFVLMANLSFADSGISITIDGNKINLQGAEPYILSGRTLVPIRFIIENLGATVDWDGSNQSALIKSSDKNILVKVGQMEAVVNENTLTMEIKPELTNGRVYVPLRAIAELLDVSVDWDGNSKTVIIKTITKEAQPPQNEEPVKEQPKQEEKKEDIVKENINVSDILDENGRIKQEIARKYERELLNSLKFENGKLTGYVPVPPKDFTWEMGFTVEYDPKYKVNNLNMGFLLADRTLTPGESFEIEVDWKKVTKGYFNVGLWNETKKGKTDWSVLEYPTMQIHEFTNRWE